MNNNTIPFNNFFIEVPKIDKDQSMLLRYVLMTVEGNKMYNNSYYIDSNLFGHLSDEKLKKLLKRNIKITFTDRRNNSWTNFYVINDISLKAEKIFFRPANILRNIILNSGKQEELTFLKFILFNGIKHKQTLLLLNYLLKLDKYYFNISVVDLKRLLELEEHQYENFSTFKKSIIERAINEINEKTSLIVEYYISKKERKKVVELTFKYYTKELQKQ